MGLPPPGCDGDIFDLFGGRLEAVVEGLRNDSRSVVVEVEIDQSPSLGQVVKLVDVDTVCSQEPDHLRNAGLGDLEFSAEATWFTGLHEVSRLRTK